MIFLVIYLELTEPWTTTWKETESHTLFDGLRGTVGPFFLLSNCLDTITYINSIKLVDSGLTYLIQWFNDVKHLVIGILALF